MKRQRIDAELVEWYASLRGVIASEYRRHGPLGIDDVRQTARIAILDALKAHEAYDGDLRGFIVQRVKWRIRDAYRSADKTPPVAPTGFTETDDDSDSRCLAAADESLDPSVITEARETRTSLRRALDALAPNHRRVLGMLHVLDMPYREVAACEGLTLGATKSLAHRARAALRAQLEGETL